MKNKKLLLSRTSQPVFIAEAFLCVAHYEFFGGEDINSDTIYSVSVDEITNDFLRVARLADEFGSVVITENGLARFKLLSHHEDIQTDTSKETRSEDEALDILRRIAATDDDIFETLAKKHREEVSDCAAATVDDIVELSRRIIMDHKERFSALSRDNDG